MSTHGIAAITLLGATAPVKWRQTADALEVELPAAKPRKHAYALKIAVKGNLE